VPKTLKLVTPGGLPDCSQPFLATTHSTTTHAVSYPVTSALYRPGSRPGSKRVAEGFPPVSLAASEAMKDSGTRDWARAAAIAVLHSARIPPSVLALHLPVPYHC
jgi:hypothetical protein